MNLLKPLAAIHRFLPALMLATLAHAKQDFFIASHSPQKSENHVAPTTIIKLYFNQPISTATFPRRPVNVFGDVLGYYDGTISFENENRTLCFKPKRPFSTGENVWITVNRSLTSINGQRLDRPFAFSFNIASASSSLHYRLLRSIPLGNAVYPIQISACDLNRDGLADFVVGDSGDTYNLSKLIILRRAGNEIGQYTLEEKFSGSSTCCFLLATFDEDIYADIIALDYGKNSLHFFKGEENHFADSIIFQTLKRPIWGDIADYDGDGDIDFAIASIEIGGAIFENDGNANFNQAKAFGEDLALRFVNWNDVDHDGRLELLAADIAGNGGNLQVYVSDSLGNFHLASQAVLKSFASSFQLHDLDADGDRDVVTAEPLFPAPIEPRAGILEVLLNNDDGKFFSHQILSPRGTLPFLLSCRDLDGDGDIDIACANSGVDPGPHSQPDSSVAFFVNDGAGKFNWLTNLKVGRLPKGLCFVDINQDARLDLAVVTVDPPALHLFLADTLTSGINDKPLPTTPRLALKIYPNPFHETVAIHFQTPLNTAGELRIFDLMGRKIFTAPVHSGREKGTIVWNGRDARNQFVPSGIYIAQLLLGHVSASQKLLLLR